MVGDTEADVMAAKALGLVSCAVTSGLRSAEFLRALKPDYLIQSIEGLPVIDKFAALTNPRH
jgi:phosphoglycolate phosphatase-like HAD superfamily hydrolase